MTSAANHQVAIKTCFALAMSAAVYFRIHGFISHFVMALLLLGAFLSGGWEERWVAGALAVTVEILAVGPALRLFPHSFDVGGSRIGVVLIGSIYLALLIVVAIRSAKWWPSWVAAFQLLLVLSHPLFVVLRGAIQPWAYASGIVIWTWLQLIAIGCGVLDCWWQVHRPAALANAR